MMLGMMMRHRQSLVAFVTSTHSSMGSATSRHSGPY